MNNTDQYNNKYVHLNSNSDLRGNSSLEDTGQFNNLKGDT